MLKLLSFCRKVVYEYTAIKVSFVALLLSLLASCAGRDEYIYHSTPKFDPITFFQGELCVRGILYDRHGDLSRKFVASIDATSDESSFSLDEHFLFDDGEQQTRLWSFKKQPAIDQSTGPTDFPDATIWQGTAADVDGVAHGLIAGDTFFLDYVLKIHRAEKGDSESTNRDDPLHINMSDKLHLVDENTLIGVTQMSWWGFDAGSIHLVIQKQSGDVNPCRTQDSSGKNL